MIVKMRQAQATKGVLYQDQSEKHYKLVRIPATKDVSEIIEQFWWVKWTLANKQHEQQNLPDPSTNLVFEYQGATLYGPIKRKFSYLMAQSGEKFGVKFTPAGYYLVTQANMPKLVDKQIKLVNWQQQPLAALYPPIADKIEFEARARLFEKSVADFDQRKMRKACKVNQIIAYIRAGPDIFNTNQVADYFNIGERQLQRLFKQYVGLTPKWIIRKARMQECIEALQSGDYDWQILIEQLGFYDQAHFIKEFKLMTGFTPGQYIQGFAS